MEEKEKFELGQVVATSGALDALEEVGILPRLLLYRHITGDWGNLGEEDKKLNDVALVEGNRILSAYILPSGQKVWLITEWDRSRTTILLPSDY